MTSLSDRIENVFNETRMLLLGGQVLLGFAYSICFEESFERLPHGAQLVELTCLGIMTVSLGWLIWPTAFHQISQKGRETAMIEKFTSRVLAWALVPLGASLALIFYPTSIMLRLPYPAWISIGVGLFAMAIWYGALLVHRDRSKRTRQFVRPAEPEKKPAEELSGRIKKVLIECRMALPGAQAFLGFQFAIVFMHGFEGLSHTSQMIHFASLLATTISIVLFIAPAAYHRLVEGGFDSERFHLIATRFLLVGLFFLAPGMAGDFWVIVLKLTNSLFFANCLSLFLLLTFYGLWFGVSLWKRS